MNYLEKDYRTYREDAEGVELMANFTARITRETRYLDGWAARSVLTVEGEQAPPADQEEPVKLPPVEVDAESFASLAWVVPGWGVRCVVRPGMKDDLRTAIQQESAPELVTIYGQTGWVLINGKQTYLHAGGGIGKGGNDPSISVRLPAEMMRYDLRTTATPEDGIGAALDLLDVCRQDVTWPLLAAALAPLYGSVDFALHVTGRTGSFKSELMSLYQSLYGAGMDARHLPGSWSSTPNALEGLAFVAANAVFVIDDFVPSGSSYQIRAYQQKADQLFRGQGNQAGRQRMTDTSSMQQTRFPRGVIFSTGEDTPEGHSVRGRMLIMELAAGEITSDALSAAQARRQDYPACIAWLAGSLAQEPAGIGGRKLELRKQYLGMGHSRTPDMLATLQAVAEDWLRRITEAGMISEAERVSYTADATDAIRKIGETQTSFLEDTDPVDVFFQALRSVLQKGSGHLRTLRGNVPEMAERLGWTSERASGEMANYKARGPCIGWVNWPTDELFVEANVGFNVISREMGRDMPLGKQTLFKRLKDAGTLPRVDAGRQRNTIRVTAENHGRQVLCLSLTTALDLEDTTDASDAEDETQDTGGDGTAAEFFDTRDNNAIGEP